MTTVTMTTVTMTTVTMTTVTVTRSRFFFPLMLALVAGCKTAPEVKADAKPPELPQQDLAVVTQSLTETTVKLSGQILAGDEALTVTGAAIEFVVDGAVIKTGTTSLSLSIAPGQTAPFSFEQRFAYVKDADELKAMDARGGSMLIALRGTLNGTVQREVLVDGKPTTQAVAIELPFARARDVRTPRLPLLADVLADLLAAIRARLPADSGASAPHDGFGAAAGAVPPAGGPR
jgi:hypothetical protein